ncbi:caspase family protein [Methylopila sp. M107]|uniref:caspase family protein n=1 Tax=Methylopila sp. M107 TaxID=1101190 RepID=UPI00035C7025|nr:caspase family protein [Methylopila sp. M107]
MRLLGLVFAILLATLGTASAERRVALVVGIDSYPALGAERQLKNAVNDAKAVGAALQGLGFDVLTAENPTRGAFVDKLFDLAARLKTGDTAFFFYAGHGVSFDGANYFLPSDVPLPRATGRAEEERLAGQAIGEQMIMKQLKDSGASVVMLVFDACRDNPLASAGKRSLGGTRGLAVTAPPRGAIALYSAGAGEAALDRLGDDDTAQNSVFTRVLIDKMTKPGLSVSDMARGIRNEVVALAEKVGHEQTPALYDQMIGKEYYLAGPPDAAKAELGLPPQAPTPDRAEIEWSYIKDNANSKMVADIMTRYPSSELMPAWRERYAALQREEASARQTPPTPPPSPPQSPPAYAPPQQQPAYVPPAPDPRDQFRLRFDTDFPERDVDEFRDVDQQACVSRCAGDGRCQAFTYNVTKRVCFLKSGVARVLSFKNVVSGVKRGSGAEAELERSAYAAPSGGGGEAQPERIRVTYDDVDLENYGDAGADYTIVWNSNFRSCKSSCENDRRCRAFTFNIGKRACILKSSFKKAARFGGAISGVKD